jgi:biopolymer transport protein ExbD
VFKRPSSRRKSDSSELIELNLVPILDTMVTLIAFMLFTMSFYAFVSIETPFPTLSTRQMEEKLNQKPLQLTLSLSEKEAEIWSPFERIPARKIPHLDEGKPDTMAIHQALLEIKRQFPLETQIVVAPFQGASYDVLIAVMDAVRTLDKADPPIFSRNPDTGNDEQVRALFPEIVFGNLLGDA